MSGLVVSLGDEHLSLPTPCPRANLGDVIDHLGVFAVRFAAVARKESEGRTSSPPPPSGANLERGWRDRISRDLSALADDACLLDRLLGLTGRDPAWRPPD
jgi:Mycothiol maleylpyruvate isomerase N-terminal domain